jgi:cell division protein FtsQ
MGFLNRKRNTRRSTRRSARNAGSEHSAARAWSFMLPALNWRRIAVSLASVTLTALAVLGLTLLLNQPIQHVIVSGRLQRVSALDVEKIVRARLGGDGLVSADLDDISRGLHTLPWVDHASVQRRWPRSLSIEIVEQVAVARWNNAGLLNARGQLFLSESRFVPPELPQLAGPAGTEQEVTARYLTVQGRLTEVGMRLAALELDARGAWSLTLDNGVLVRLGRAQVDERFERFMLAAARLVSQRATDIAYVDMRYSNGFALGWKAGGSGSGGSSSGSGAPVHG